MLVAWLASEMVKYNVKPEIEAFDLSHIFQAKLMSDRGELLGTPYVQFVLGVKNATPVDRAIFDFYIQTNFQSSNLVHLLHLKLNLKYLLF